EEPASDGRRHAGRDPKRLLAKVLNRRLAMSIAARARALRPPGGAGSLHGGIRPIHAHFVEGSARTNRFKTPRHASGRNVLVLQRTKQQRSRLSFAALRS